MKYIYMYVYTVYVYDSDIRIGPLICILWGPLTTIVGEILGPHCLNNLGSVETCHGCHDHQRRSPTIKRAT